MRERRGRESERARERERESERERERVRERVRERERERARERERESCITGLVTRNGTQKSESNLGKMRKGFVQVLYTQSKHQQMSCTRQGPHVLHSSIACCHTIRIRRRLLAVRTTRKMHV